MRKLTVLDSAHDQANDKNHCEAHELAYCDQSRRESVNVTRVNRAVPVLASQIVADEVDKYDDADAQLA